MNSKCLKCGAIRTEQDQGPEGECPNCGAVYSKVSTAAHSGRLQPKASANGRVHGPRTPTISMVFYALSVVSLVAGTVAFFVSPQGIISAVWFVSGIVGSAQFAAVGVGLKFLVAIYDNASAARRL